MCDNENPLIVWGDGSNVRDFVYCDDVASSILKIIQKNITKPINIGSGKGTSIKNLVKLIVNLNILKINQKLFLIKLNKVEIKKEFLILLLLKAKHKK